MPFVLPTIATGQDGVQNDIQHKAKDSHFDRVGYDSHGDYCNRLISIRTPTWDTASEIGE